MEKAKSKSRTNAEELRLLIEEAKQLQKTCEAITRMVAFIEIGKMVAPAMESQLKMIAEGCKNKRKEKKKKDPVELKHQFGRKKKVD